MNDYPHGTAPTADAATGPGMTHSAGPAVKGGRASGGTGRSRAPQGNGAQDLQALRTSPRYYEFIKEHPEISERDIRIIAEQLPGARRILDIGCGAGGFLAMCRERLGDALGLDPSSASALLCRARSLPVVIADGARLPFASGSVDVVRAKEILEHIPDLLAFVRDIHRVLKPGGLFLSQTPTQFSILYPVPNFYDDYTHIRPLSRLGIQRLFADANFETLYIRGYTAGRNPLQRLLGRLLARLFPLSWVALARKPGASSIR